MTNTRSNPANPAAFTAEAMKATTGVGEPSYTSGVHEWNGTAATLKPNPTSKSPKPASNNAGGWPAGIENDVPFVFVTTTRPKSAMRARFVEPVEPYTSA